MTDFTSLHSCQYCVRKTKIFSVLTEAELIEIDRHRHEIEYEPGEIIFKQGAPYTHLLSFVHGLAKIYIETHNNKPLIIKLVKDQEFLFGPGLYTGDKHFYSVKAIEKSQVCAIDKNIFQKILSQNSTFLQEFLKAQNANYSDLVKKLININQKNARGRVAETLIYLSEDIYNSNPFQLTISILEISDFTGLSKESTFRSLKDFSDSGYISISKKEINILDKQMLKIISQKG